MKRLSRVILLVVITATPIQWIGIGEKIHHAVWQWYKFSEYSHDGHTTVSYSMFMVTLALSLVLVAVGLFAFKTAPEPMVSKLSLVCALLLAVGGLALIGTVASPLGELVIR